MKESWLWKEEDILNLIHNKVRESLNLEYKSCDALAKTEGKRKEISKDVSAFANSAGGTIVYGVTENRSTHEPDDIDIGYDPQDISDEWLEQVINSNIQRRIDGIRINTVALINTRPGQVLYVVYIPESNLAPHMAADNRFYKRFNFESVPMEEYEIRYLTRREHYPSREVARAWRDAVINPLLCEVVSEQYYLNRRKWTWNIYGRSLEELRNISDRSTYSGLKEEFLGLHVEIQDQMDRHDELAAKVKANCETLFHTLAESSFLLELYNRTTSPESLQQMKSNFPSELARYDTDESLLSGMFGHSTSRPDHLRLLSQYIMNGMEKLPHNYTTKPFWDTHREGFLLLIEYPPLSEHKGNVDRAREELLHCNEALISQLKKTRSEISRQHGIPIEEPVKGEW